MTKVFCSEVQGCIKKCHLFGTHIISSIPQNKSTKEFCGRPMYQKSASKCVVTIRFDLRYHLNWYHRFEHWYEYAYTLKHTLTQTHTPWIQLLG